MTKSLLYAARLLILGVGIGAIAGTLLSVLDPTSRVSIGAQSTANNIGDPKSGVPVAAMNSANISNAFLTQENINLKTALLSLASKQPKLTPSVFMVDLDSGVYVDVNGSTTVAAASTIKFPILVAFFQDVDAGKIRLDEMMTMDQSVVATGSGDMQSKPVGSQFTALEAASKMSIISDNTATNMLINRLGGAASLNQRFRTWGMTATQIRNPLPDLEGTNSTSPRDLGNLMTLVSQGNLLSLRSRDRLMDIMRRTVRDNLLPSGLSQEASIAHKTGDIGSMLGDVGLVDMPNGKRYIAVVMVKRPHNDPKATKLITDISRTAYQQFSQTAFINPSPSGTLPNSTTQTNTMQYPTSTGTTP
jgi:beta-lactamase class A